MNTTPKGDDQSVEEYDLKSGLTLESGQLKPESIQLDPLAQEKEKIFRDSVHGYISVPSKICDDFIDTPIFQRLRHIEQTSMRVLYPSAHHDRFIHSLGVYHLGRIAFSSLKRNSKRRWDLSESLKITEAKWLEYEYNFTLACLLHDCGHSPFSHTLEDNYKKSGLLNEKLRELSTDDQFNNDLELCSPATHEKTSAILVLSKYSDKIKESPYSCNPVLMARMILGCLHHTVTRSTGILTEEEMLENCLIQLLNGNAIDVDKLDYILRDTWASGVDNVSVDVERLLGSLILTKINNEFPRLAFSRQALSVIQTAVDARNYLYRWIYTHHKVIYDVDLLQKTIEILAKKITDNSSDDFYKKVFSIESFSERLNIGDFQIYFPTDGDLIYLMKKYSDEIKEAREWLFREHSRVALWKNFAEYENIFKNVSERQRKVIFSHRKEIFTTFCAQESLPEDTFLVLDAQPKTVVIERNQLFIEIRESVVPYTEIFDEKKEDIPTYFLVYGSRELLTRELHEKCLKNLVAQM